MTDHARPPLEPGPWDDEPDLEEWQSREGYRCVIMREQTTWTLCGYVALPECHPWWGRDLFEVPAIVHGGCAFSGPSPDASVDWWIGFDCAHFSDRKPGLEAMLREAGAPSVLIDFPGVEYRTIDYVRSEVTNLAAQVKLAAEMRVFAQMRAEA